MARPPKTGLPYFPLFTDFFDDADTKALRREHGSIGISTWLYIRCRAHGENGYYFYFSTLEDLAADIAEHISNSHIRRVTSLVLDVINYLISVSLIDPGAVEQRLITGRKIQEQYVEIQLRSRRTPKLDVHPLVDVSPTAPKNGIIVAETEVIATETPVIATIMPQSIKGKEESINSTLYSVYGTHHNVRLTDAQYNDIKSKIPNADAYIDHFSERLKARGYTIKDHHGAILEWWEKDKDKPQRREAKPMGSFDTDDFFQAAVNKGFRTHRDD